VYVMQVPTCAEIHVVGKSRACYASLSLCSANALRCSRGAVVLYLPACRVSLMID
jgi:hypothetical protein